MPPYTLFCLFVFGGLRQRKFPFTHTIAPLLSLGFNRKLPTVSPLRLLSLPFSHNERSYSHWHSVNWLWDRQVKGTPRLLKCHRVSSCYPPMYHLWRIESVSACSHWSLPPTQMWRKHYWFCCDSWCGFIHFRSCTCSSLFHNSVDTSSLFWIGCACYLKHHKEDVTHMEHYFTWQTLHKIKAPVLVVSRLLQASVPCKCSVLKQGNSRGN